MASIHPAALKCCAASSLPRDLAPATTSGDGSARLGAAESVSVTIEWLQLNGTAPSDERREARNEIAKASRENLARGSRRASFEPRAPISRESGDLLSRQLASERQDALGAGLSNRGHGLEAGARILL